MPIALSSNVLLNCEVVVSSCCDSAQNFNGRSCRAHFESDLQRGSLVQFHLEAVDRRFGEIRCCCRDVVRADGQVAETILTRSEFAMTRSSRPCRRSGMLTVALGTTAPLLSRIVPTRSPLITCELTAPTTNPNPKNHCKEVSQQLVVLELHALLLELKLKFLCQKPGQTAKIV